MTIIIPPEVTEKVIDEVCYSVDLSKHIIEGPHRTDGSYAITDVKSFRTTVNKSKVAFDATHEILSDWFNKYYNDGYLKGMTDSMSLIFSVREKTFEKARQYYKSHIDPKSVVLGVGIAGGLFVAGKITKSIIERKSNKENKKESKES